MRQGWNPHAYHKSGQIYQPKVDTMDALAKRSRILLAAVVLSLLAAGVASGAGEGLVTAERMVFATPENGGSSPLTWLRSLRNWVSGWAFPAPW